MALPTVQVSDFTILLGTTIVSTEVFGGFDPDGDTIEKFRVRDNNSNSDSSYWIKNGIIIPPNSWVEVAAVDLNLLILNPGTSIQKNSFDYQAYSAGEWGPIAEGFVHSVVTNNQKPIVNAQDISIVQSEYLILGDYISATDPDGFPIKRYRIYDSNPGITSARIEVNGVTLVAGQWNYLWPEELQVARFYAAQAAPNNDPIYIRAFDRYNGNGVTDNGQWSDPVNINGFTTVNFNRPIGIPTEYDIATDETVAVTKLFGWSDADANTLKRVRFWDTTPHFWSGNLTEFGVELPSEEWIERDVSALANIEWDSASRSFIEQVRFQVFDGNHWSDVETFRVRTNEKPVIGVAEDYSVRQQLEFVDISNLIIKLDDGPNYTHYQVYDATTSSLSGNFRLGATTLTAGQVHDVTPQEFFDLQFKSGVFEVRSLDDTYVRAFNGTFWSDWTRHTIFTEPEYLDSLATASWLNFRPQVNGTLPLTFSFMQTWPTYGTAGQAPEAEFITPWDPMRDQVRQAFVRMEELINVDFEEVADSVNTEFGQGGTIRIGTYCFANTGTVAYASFPGPEEVNGDMWFNRWWTGSPPVTNAEDPPCGFPQENQPPPPGYLLPLDNWDKGDFNYSVFIHELGHAMGLKHPFDGSPVLPSATNTGFFTHMSYAGATYPEWGQELYDISALQSIYGANTTHASGDTLYNSDTWRGNFDVVDSIWDTGGIDTIDASDQISGASFDLRPGRFNQIGGGTISIAFNTVIENAIGTQFADSFIGNEVANTLVGGGGNDVFEGYGGDDLLQGGANNDTYNYKMFDGNDTINELFGAGRDSIDLGLFLELDDFTTDLSFTRRNFDMIVDFTIDDGITRGSITVEGQGFGRNRIETLNVLGVPVDLRFLFNSITEPGQQFVITGNMAQFGFEVSPV